MEEVDAFLVAQPRSVSEPTGRNVGVVVRIEPSPAAFVGTSLYDSSMIILSTFLFDLRSLWVKVLGEFTNVKTKNMDRLMDLGDRCGVVACS